MICILAGSKREAELWSRGQFLKPSEWFFGDELNLFGRNTYHIITLPGFFELPESYRNRVEDLARGHRKNT